MPVHWMWQGSVLASSFMFVHSIARAILSIPLISFMVVVGAVVDTVHLGGSGILGSGSRCPLPLAISPLLVGQCFSSDDAETYLSGVGCCFAFLSWQGTFILIIMNLSPWFCWVLVQRYAMLSLFINASHIVLYYYIYYSVPKEKMLDYANVERVHFWKPLQCLSVGWPNFVWPISHYRFSHVCGDFHHTPTAGKTTPIELNAPDTGSQVTLSFACSSSPVIYGLNHMLKSNHSCTPAKNSTKDGFSIIWSTCSKRQ